MASRDYLQDTVAKYIGELLERDLQETLYFP